MPGNIKIKGQYRLEIDLYYKNPSCDGANIIALTEKVFLDAVQQHNTVNQDNVKYHIGTTWNVIGQDKQNPRTEITIKELK